MDRGTLAAELFLQGYNCSQAVVLAFRDVTGLDDKMAARLSSGFGGGMGRMREVCGAVSGMVLVAGMLYGYDETGNDPKKKELYTLIQDTAAQFRAETGSIVCREILKNPPSDPNPTPRTAEFYQKRPCARMVKLAADILSRYVDGTGAEV